MDSGDSIKIRQQLQCVARQMKSARATTGLSAQEVSVATGIHRNTIRAIEAGTTNCTLLNLLKLANFYNVDVKF